MALLEHPLVGSQMVCKAINIFLCCFAARCVRRQWDAYSLLAEFIEFQLKCLKLQMVQGMMGHGGLQRFLYSIILFCELVWILRIVWLLLPLSIVHGKINLYFITSPTLSYLIIPTQFWYMLWTTSSHNPLTTSGMGECIYTLFCLVIGDPYGGCWHGSLRGCQLSHAREPCSSSMAFAPIVQAPVTHVGSCVVGISSVFGVDLMGSENHHHVLILRLFVDVDVIVTLGHLSLKESFLMPSLNAMPRLLLCAYHGLIYCNAISSKHGPHSLIGCCHQSCQAIFSKTRIDLCVAPFLSIVWIDLAILNFIFF